MTRQFRSTISWKVVAFTVGCTLSLLFIFTFFNSSHKIPKKQNFQGRPIRKYEPRKHLFPYDPSYPANYTPWGPYWRKLKHRMSLFIINRLKYKFGGFFIECGALDGVGLSNTLLLEQKYNWTGLLVEADPIPGNVLKARNRRAWVADVCLTTSVTPTKITMSRPLEGDSKWNAGSHIVNDVLGKTVDGGRKFEVDCYPLYMLLHLIGRTQIDYFSLDVEGVELDILKTIPFHRVNIKLISVEVRPGNKDAIQSYLESVGYVRILEMVDHSEYIHDDVYELVNSIIGAVK